MVCAVVIERDAGTHGRAVVEGAHLQLVLHAAGALHRDHGFVAAIDGHGVIAPGRVLLIDGAVAGLAERDGLAEIAVVHRQAQRGGGKHSLILALDRPGQLTRGIGLDFDLDLPVRTGDGHRCGIRHIGQSRTRDLQRGGILRHLLLGQRDRQAFGGLLPLEFPVVSQERDLFDTVDVRTNGFGQRPDRDFAILGPAESKGVQGVALGRKPDFLGIVLEILLEVAAFDLDRAFAVNQPGARAEDRFAVDGVPLGELLEHLLDLGIERAVRALHHVEQEISVLADVVHQHVDDPAHRAELPVPVVEPVSNRGVGLPGIWINPRHDAAFEVLNPAAFGFLLAVIDDLDLAVIAGGAVVIEMSDHAITDRVAEGDPAVRVEQVGMVVVHQFLDFVVPLLLPARIFGVPAPVVRFSREMVEILIFRIGAVIRHAGLGAFLVGTMAGLEPGEAGAQVFGHAELETVAFEPPSASRPPRRGSAPC